MESSIISAEILFRHFRALDVLIKIISDYEFTKEKLEIITGPDDVLYHFLDRVEFNNLHCVFSRDLSACKTTFISKYNKEWRVDVSVFYNRRKNIIFDLMELQMKIINYYFHHHAEFVKEHLKQISKFNNRFLYHQKLFECVEDKHLKYYLCGLDDLRNDFNGMASTLNEVIVKNYKDIFLKEESMEYVSMENEYSINIIRYLPNPVIFSDDDYILPRYSMYIEDFEYYETEMDYLKYIEYQLSSISTILINDVFSFYNHFAHVFKSAIIGDVDMDKIRGEDYDMEYKPFKGDSENDNKK